MAKKKAAKKVAGGKDALVVASKVKSFIRGKGLMASSEAIGVERQDLCIVGCRG